MAPKAKRDGQHQFIMKGIDRRLWMLVRAYAADRDTTVKAIVLAHLESLVKGSK